MSSRAAARIRFAGEQELKSWMQSAEGFAVFRGTLSSGNGPPGVFHYGVRQTSNESTSQEPFNE